MVPLAHALFAVTALAYAVASVLFVLQLAGKTASEAWGPRAMALGVALHVAHVVATTAASHAFPVRGVHFALSVLSALVGAVYLVVRTRYRLDVVGTVVAPLALSFLLAARFAGTEGETGALKGALLPIHILANVLGEALFLMAAASAVLYLVQDRRLKAKRFGGVGQRLPPLATLDRVEHGFLLAGFPPLTVGILTGTLWARQVELGSIADMARTGFGYVSWFLFAGVLLLRAAAGWRGRRAAYGTLIGFGFALLVLAFYWLRSFASPSAIAYVDPRNEAGPSRSALISTREIS